MRDLRCYGKFLLRRMNLRTYFIIFDEILCLLYSEFKMRRCYGNVKPILCGC